MNIEQEIKLQIGELAVNLMALRVENEQLKAKIETLEKASDTEVKQQTEEVCKKK